MERDSQEGLLAGGSVLRVELREQCVVDGRRRADVRTGGQVRQTNPRAQLEKKRR